ncbi:MAG TPA: 23S rRNA (uracil(1939)-C(5))-methyltransferase RlmD [Lachnospiraceae bacterium]
MYRKNDTITIEIEDISHEGLGIGKKEGFPFFIKDALVGDIIEAKIVKLKKNYGFARVEKIVRESNFRVKARCPIAKPCGGCQLQELSYEKQLEFKKNLIINNLKRIGGMKEVPFEEMIGMENPYRYRNKAQFPIGKNREGKIIAGFYAGRTHSIIENEDCYLGVKQNKEILKVLIGHMEKFKIPPYDEKTGMGLVRHVLIRYGFMSGQIMVCIVINGNKLAKEELLVEDLRKISGMTSISLNRNQENTNVILGKELRLLWGKAYIEDYLGEIAFEISPLSFYQVNPVQTKILYEKALEYADLTGKERVWDLYCGIGTISLFLSKKAKEVYGVEIIPQAIEDARNNARKNGIKNVEFFVGKAEDVVAEQYEKKSAYADVIVVDPPRKGCDEKLLTTMFEMAPEKIVYVSCDSATLARDIKILQAGGYEVKRVCGVDQFCHTVHVESVVLLSRTD